MEVRRRRRVVGYTVLRRRADEDKGEEELRMSRRVGESGMEEGKR